MRAHFQISRTSSVTQQFTWQFSLRESTGFLSVRAWTCLPDRRSRKRINRCLGQVPSTMSLLLEVPSWLPIQIAVDRPSKPEFECSQSVSIPLFFAVPARRWQTHWTKALRAQSFRGPKRRTGASPRSPTRKRFRPAKVARAFELFFEVEPVSRLKPSNRTQKGIT